VILVDSSVLIDFLKGRPTDAGSRFEAVLEHRPLLLHNDSDFAGMARVIPLRCF
jgi:hypothetical protein